MTATGWFMLVVALAIVAWEIAALCGAPWKTISETVWDLCRRWPELRLGGFLALAVLAWHLFAEREA